MFPDTTVVCDIDVMVSSVVTTRWADVVTTGWSVVDTSWSSVEGSTIPTVEVYVSTWSSEKWFKAILHSHNLFDFITFSMYILLWMYISLDLFVWTSPSCEEREANENSKWKYTFQRIRTSNIAYRWRLRQLADDELCLKSYTIMTYEYNEPMTIHVCVCRMQILSDSHSENRPTILS